MTRRGCHRRRRSQPASLWSCRDVDLARYPSPEYRRFVELGCKSACSVPLVTSNGTLGTLEIARTTRDVWTDEDVDFLVQVARQIAIAVENALSYRQLREMKERLATEKLYLEDEIRLDYNNGNMVGEGAAFQSVLKSVQIVAPTDATVLILGETGTGKELVARAIHELSSRSRGSFVKVNCAAIPGQPARERAVRAREGLVHRSGGAEDRTLRTGASRNALSR